MSEKKEGFVPPEKRIEKSTITLENLDLGGDQYGDVSGKDMFRILQDKFGLEQVTIGLIEHLRDPEAPAHPIVTDPEGPKSFAALADKAEELLRMIRKMNADYAESVRQRRLKQ